jgi:hypothetical protein
MRERLERLKQEERARKMELRKIEVRNGQVAKE